MRNSLLFLSLFLLLVLIHFSLHAQSGTTTDANTWQIELFDGSKLIGNIIAEDENFIQFKTLSGTELKIPRTQVRKKELLKGEFVGGKLWRDDPNRTRLLFSATGRALKQGQGYFSIYEVFFPFIAYGATDWLALAGGVTLFPGSSKQLVYLAPKITFLQQSKIDVSAGVLYIRIPDFDDDDNSGESNEDIHSAGIMYGVSTYGTEKSSLTFGLGYAFGGGEIAKKPVFMLGGELRASSSIKFVSENWLIPDSEVQLLSIGLRFFGEKLAADFALFYPAGADTRGFPFFPWIGFAYNFGSQK